MTEGRKSCALAWHSVGNTGCRPLFHEIHGLLALAQAVERAVGDVTRRIRDLPAALAEESSRSLVASIGDLRPGAVRASGDPIFN